MNDSIFVEQFQGNEHLISDRSNSFDVKSFIFFLEDAIEIVVEFFHDHVRVLLEYFVGVDFGEAFSVHQVNHHFEFLFDEDRFLGLGKLILFHDFFRFCMRSTVRCSWSGRG